MPSFQVTPTVAKPCTFAGAESAASRCCGGPAASAVLSAAVSASPWDSAVASSSPAGEEGAVRAASGAVTTPGISSGSSRAAVASIPETLTSETRGVTTSVSA